MHGDALVAVAVGDVGLVRLRVDEDLRDLAEVLGVVAAARSALACRTARGTCRRCVNFRMCAVVAAVAADPDVALVVDGDAVVRLAASRSPRPGPAPVADDVAVLIELEDGRRLRAAARRSAASRSAAASFRP